MRKRRAQGQQAASGIFQPGHTRLPQQNGNLKTQAETPFPYLHASSSLFRPVFCVLSQRPCVHYTELFVGFVGRSLTKPAQVVDIFSSIIGVFFTHLSSCSQRQVSLSLPFGLFLPAHPRRAIRAVFGPVGLRREHGPAYGAAFHLAQRFTSSRLLLISAHRAASSGRTAARNHRHSSE